jgi:hypothetical protein
MNQIDINDSHYAEDELQSLVYMISMAMMFHLQYIMAFLPFSTEDRKAAV